MAGFFVSMEGPEGAGKSTQLALLAEWLTAEGSAARRVREPGGMLASTRCCSRPATGAS